MLMSKVIASFSRLTVQQPALLCPLQTICVNQLHTDITLYGSRHGGFYKKDYRVLRERPIGPHKILPPNEKHDGRIGPKKNYRYIVHYPEDGKYTVNKLPMTKLGGRDPKTGRKIIGRVGGGSKQKFRWIQWQRLPQDWPRDGPDLVEKVIKVCYDPVRKPMIALTGYADKLRWQIATAGMKNGDLITTTWKIPSIPVKPVVGNSYPVGSLPQGTQICLLQKYANKVSTDAGDLTFYNENTYGTIVRKIGDRVIVEDGGKKKTLRSYDQHCQCVVGQISIHPLKACAIGSPNRLRWLGRRPRSGLWHRKTGRHGKKIRALPPVRVVDRPDKKKDKPVILTCRTEGTRGRINQKNKPFPIDLW